MPETRHELSVGESLIIDDCLVTVTEIVGDKVLFRIERIPGHHESDLESAGTASQDSRPQSIESLSSAREIERPAEELSGRGLAAKLPRRSRPR